MPADYYSPDNFFKKMTDLDSPRKNNDCYFYYYSTCSKGDNCTFRHEPSALGCETMCSFWREGKCLNVHCNFRHMELRKNRKTIQCYWETQPGGCLKPHCPFMHQNTQGDESSVKHKQENDITANNPNTASIGVVEKKIKNQGVDSLVVNFEEESDCESSSFSPMKNEGAAKDIEVKSLEQIKLERIQAESAAYYSYPVSSEEDLRERLLSKMQQKKNVQISLITAFPTDVRKRKSTAIEQLTIKKSKILFTSKDADIGNIKIKTLAEIRAERMAKEQRDNEVTSTSKDEQLEQKNQTRLSRKKIKLRKTPPPDIENLSPIEQNRETKIEFPIEEDVMMTPISDEDKLSASSIKQDDIENTLSVPEITSPEPISEVNEVQKTANLSPTDLEEVLLLGEDEDLSSTCLKAEDELLEAIDDFLR